MSKLRYALFTTVAFNAGIFCNEYKIAPSLSYKGASVESAIRAAQPAPKLSVPAHPINKEIGRALLPGFAQPFLKAPTTGVVAKK